MIKYRICRKQVLHKDLNEKDALEKLHQLKKQWNDWKACPECYDPKQPQLEIPTNTVDPQALYEPRPSIDVEAGEGVVRTENPGFVNSKEDLIGHAFRTNSLNGQLGSITVVV